MRLLYSFMLLPVFFLFKFLVTSFLSLSNVGAVNWHQLKHLQWHRDIQPISDGILKTFAVRQDQADFNSTLDAILIPRIVGTEGHRRVREYIVNSLNNLDWTVEQDSFTALTPLGKKPFSNVIATLDPKACHRLVLACHYDSKVDKKGIFLGATDSAVPCAQIINLVRVLDPELKELRNQGGGLTLQLMFFDGEEAFETWNSKDSLYGSRHLAEKLNSLRYNRQVKDELRCDSDSDVVNDLDRIDVLVLLDLLGGSNPKFYSYFGDTHSLYSGLVNIEQRLNSLHQMEAEPPETRTNYFDSRSTLGFVEDDHIPFLKRGVPIIHLIPSPFPPVWHKLTDNKDNLHHPTIHNLNKILRAFVAEYLNLQPKSTEL